jgi:hypothetical protein
MTSSLKLPELDIKKSVGGFFPYSDNQRAYPATIRSNGESSGLHESTLFVTPGY